jgi:integrase
MRVKNLPPGVSEHPDRNGVIWYRPRVVINGKRMSLGLYTTPEEASGIRESTLKQVGGQQRGFTLVTWGERWLDARETDGVHRATENDRSRWNTHIATAPFATKPLRKIERIEIVRWVKQLIKTHAVRAKKFVKTGKVERRDLDRKLGRSTIVNALALLRRALADAADEGHVAANVAAGVRVPKIARTDETWTYLTAAEIEDVLAVTLTNEQRSIFIVATYAGLRPGELWGLRWADVRLDGDDAELVVRYSYRKPTKSGKVRRVPLLPRARAALESWRKERPAIGNALVFPADEKKTKDGLGGCHAKGFDAGWQNVKALAGIARRVRFYDLRHTCGSHLIQGTWTPEPMRLEDVQLWLGHASRVTTERYAHLSPDQIHAKVAKVNADAREKMKR